MTHDCLRCNRSYGNEIGLLRHVDIIHGGKWNGVEVVGTLSQERSPNFRTADNPCIYCGQTFSTVVGLNQHYVHMHDAREDERNEPLFLIAEEP